MTNPKDLVGAKKAPLRFVPPALVIGAAEAMAIGAEKYGPYNWRDQPVSLMTYIEAIDRHLMAFRDGEDIATDSGVHHVRHAVAGMAIILDAMANDVLIDDRPKPGPAARLLAEQDRSTPSFSEDVEARVLTTLERDLRLRNDLRLRKLAVDAAAERCESSFRARNEKHLIDCPGWTP
jgi:hypothetical protein